jgi:hypothetical protein
MANITKVPNGPLIKKKGTFKGSTLKNGGPVKKETTTTVKDNTSVKKTVMKKQELAQKPTYKNLSMAVDIDERGTLSRGSKTANKQDSVDYASGFKKGLNRKKDLFENIVSRSGRWEGENTPKKFIGGKRPMKAGGMIKRADGSMSRRGLWDSIRENKGSGKKPTAAMLKQEKKIKAKAKK